MPFTIRNADLLIMLHSVPRYSCPDRYLVLLAQPLVYIIPIPIEEEEEKGMVIFCGAT